MDDGATVELLPPQLEHQLGRRRFARLLAEARALREAEDRRAAWVAMLERYRWDWFCTLTWKLELAGLGEERRASFWRWWLRELGDRADLKPHWILAWEPHRSGALHAHALVGWTPRSLVAEHAQPHRRVAAQLWAAGGWDAESLAKRKGAGWARVEEPRSGAVEAYVTKYLLKGLGTVGNFADGVRPATGEIWFGGYFDDAPAGRGSYPRRAPRNTDAAPRT